MVPGLENIVDIAVHDHVGREVVEFHPTGPIPVQGLLHIAVQPGHAARKDLLDAPGGLLGIARGAVYRRSPEQDEGAEKQQPPGQIISPAESLFSHFTRDDRVRPA